MPKRLGMEPIMLRSFTVEEQLPPIRCLLEVALSQDADKHGIEPMQVLEVLDKSERTKISRRMV